MSRFAKGFSFSTHITPKGVEQHFDIIGEAMARFAKLADDEMEAAIRQKLIDLGWTPPNHTNHTEWP